MVLYLEFYNSYTEFINLFVVGKDSYLLSRKGLVSLSSYDKNILSRDRDNIYFILIFYKSY